MKRRFYELIHICFACIVINLIALLSIYGTHPALCAENTKEVNYSTSNTKDQNISAEEPVFEMDEIVVTATRERDQIKRIPKDVTVITSDDIALAPSNNIVDLLSREADLNLRSYLGNDKKAGIDIRGMGDTFVSNVIVMVDGFRLNPPDMAGPDFSSIPLNQIERIEIVRGAGSVLYGDGAVGGVINIITKRPTGKPQVKLYSSYGSYDTFDERAILSGGTGKLGMSLALSFYSTDGYRENNYFKKKDADAKFDYDITKALRLSLGCYLHKDKVGLCLLYTSPSPRD